MRVSLLPPLAARCAALLLLLLLVVTATLRGGGREEQHGRWEEQHGHREEQHGRREEQHGRWEEQHGRWEEQHGRWEEQHGRRGPEVQAEEQFCSWECLVFTLQWPGGFCQSLDNESLCWIPPSVDSWTIHGLWPRAESRCSCWPMFQSDVQVLEAELSDHWPSLLRTMSSFHFWRDEWRKHGSTAACVEGLNSPLRYFQICLKLRAQLDIQSLLEDAGITASWDRPYQVGDVKRVLAPHLGEQTEIQCVTDKQDRQVWFQVKIPLSRNFTLGCDAAGGPSGGSGSGSRSSPGHPCPPDVPFYYLPIDRQQPVQPCD